MIESNGQSHPAEVYVRIDNELYSGATQPDKEYPHDDRATTPTSHDNIYNEPSEPKAEKPDSYEFDSPLYASTKETDI